MLLRLCCFSVLILVAESHLQPAERDLGGLCRDGAEIEVPVFESMTDVKTFHWNGTRGVADCTLKVIFRLKRNLPVVITMIP